MTLIFNKSQVLLSILILKAIACGEAGATLVSPFVGRILDWYKKSTGQEYSAEKDPGVLSVKMIAREFRLRKLKTQVMAASFRNVHEIIELAGVDLLTISPALLEQLDKLNEGVRNKISDIIQNEMIVHETISRQKFDDDIKNDRCAFELLTQGIEKFKEDTLVLEEKIASIIKKL